MEYSSSGSRPCEPLLLSRRLSKFFKMNWTEGTLYRHSRGKLRKANVEKQRQKEYFAKAHIRAAEQKEAMKHGPPPISYLQPNTTLPKPSPDTLHSENVSFHSASQRRGRCASAPKAENPPKSEHLLPTVDQFLKEQIGKATSTDTAPPRSDTYAGEVERLRQRLLASKDWSASRIRPPVQVKKQPQVVPEHIPTARPMRATRERPVHFPQSNSILCPQDNNTSRSRSLRRTDVQIRVGSQEKRLRESSTIGRESFAHKRQDARPETSRHIMRDSSGMSFPKTV